MREVLLEMVRIVEALAPAPNDPVASWGLFLLIFVFVFVSTQFIKALADNKGARLIVGLIFAYFAARSTFAVEVLKNMAPKISILLVTGVSFLFTLAIIAPRILGSLNRVIVFFSIGVVFLVVMLSSFPSEGGIGEGTAGEVREAIRRTDKGYYFGSIFLSHEVLAGLILLMIFVFSMIGILHETEEDEESLGEKFWNLMMEEMD